MYVLIVAGDTVAGLAAKYLGSGSQASTLIQVNDLDPPFITDDPNFIPYSYAAGTAQFTLIGAGPYTVPSGTVVQTSSGPSGEIRSYTTNNPVTLASIGNTGTTTITCTVAGPLGNVAPNRVTVVQNSTIAANVSVTNTTPVTGGSFLKVLSPGQQIFIPDTSVSTSYVNVDVKMTLEQEYLSGGTGIYLTPLRGMTWNYNDLQLVENENAIGQEVASRIITPKGTVFYDANAGSLTPALIGGTSTDVMAQATLMAQRDALNDPRVISAQFSAAPYSNGWITLTGNITLQNNLTITLPVTFS